jgi:hypothetical protein
MTENHQYRSWHVNLPAGTSYAELLNPNFWTADRDRLSPHDLIRVVAEDGSFDVMLTVLAKSSAGLVMEPWPKMPAEPGRCLTGPARRGS